MISCFKSPLKNLLDANACPVIFIVMFEFMM